MRRSVAAFYFVVLAACGIESSQVSSSQQPVKSNLPVEGALPTSVEEADELIEEQRRLHEQHVRREQDLASVIARVDFAARIHVLDGAAFEDEFGGVSTRFPFTINSVLRSVGTDQFVATSIVVPYGTMGDRITVANHTPLIRGGAEYLLLARHRGQSSLQGLEFRQVLEILDDGVQDGVSQMSLATLGQKLEHLGEDTGGSN